MFHFERELNAHGAPSVLATADGCAFENGLGVHVCVGQGSAAVNRPAV